MANLPLRNYQFRRFSPWVHLFTGENCPISLTVPSQAAIVFLIQLAQIVQPHVRFKGDLRFTPRHCLRQKPLTSPSPPPSFLPLCRKKKRTRFEADDP